MFRNKYVFSFPFAGVNNEIRKEEGEEWLNS